VKGVPAIAMNIPLIICDGRPGIVLRMIQMNVGSNKLTQEVFLNAVV
jgi:hypothetical protein